MRSSETTSPPVDVRLPAPTTEEAKGLPTTWYLERNDGLVVKLTNPKGMRISWSRGEARIYVGTDKHYSATFTELQNAWGETVNAEFAAASSSWREERKKIDDAATVEATVERTVRKAKKSSAATAFPSFSGIAAMFKDPDDEDDQLEVKPW